MVDPTGGDERQELERELEHGNTEESRQGRGSTPPEHVIERALELEPGVERHAGEDAGQVPDDRDQG